MRALLAVVVVGAAIAGCGPDARLVYATQTAQLSANAITEVDAEVATAGGESADLAPALERAHVRLGEIEHSIDLWRDNGGPMAYRVHAPCLRAALLQLSAALQAAGREVPADLDEAEAMLAEVADHACPP